MKLLPVILALSSVILGACAPLKHHYREGATSDELLNKLGPPTRVNQSVNGVEVWEYDETDLLNSGTFHYYIKDGVVVRKSMKVVN